MTSAREFRIRKSIHVIRDEGEALPLLPVAVDERLTPLDHEVAHKGRDVSEWVVRCRPSAA